MGIIGILILLPIVCIILSCLSILFTLTGYVFVFIGLLLYQILLMLVYDFDYVYSYSPFGSYAFPIISITLKLVFKGAVQLAMACLYIFGIIPTLLIIFSLFGFLRYIFRSVYDYFMYGIVRCFARNPVREDNMAWRIKGPGIEKYTQYYFTIDEDDVFMLVRAELEKLQLLEFEHKLKRIIQKPYKKAQKVYRECLDVY